MNPTGDPPKPQLRLVHSAGAAPVPPPGARSTGPDAPARTTLTLLGLTLLPQLRALGHRPTAKPPPHDPLRTRHLEHIPTPEEVPMVITSSDELWKVHHVARYLSMSPSWVYKEAEAGRLPCIRIGAALRFSSLAIKHYLAGLHERSPGSNRA